MSKDLRDIVQNELRGIVKDELKVIVKDELKGVMEELQAQSQRHRHQMQSFSRWLEHRLIQQTTAAVNEAYKCSMTAPQHPLAKRQKVVDTDAAAAAAAVHEDAMRKGGDQLADVTGILCSLKNTIQETIRMQDRLATLTAALAVATATMKAAEEVTDVTAASPLLHTQEGFEEDWQLQINHNAQAIHRELHQLPDRVSDALKTQRIIVKAEIELGLQPSLGDAPPQEFLVVQLEKHLAMMYTKICELPDTFNKAMQEKYRLATLQATSTVTRGAHAGGEEVTKIISAATPAMRAAEEHIESLESTFSESCWTIHQTLRDLPVLVTQAVEMQRAVVEAEAQQAAFLATHDIPEQEKEEAKLDSEQ